MTERIRIQLWTQADRAKARHAVLSAPRGWFVELREPTRSLIQNDCMWAHLDDVRDQIPDWYGFKLSSEEWKIVFTASLKRQKVVPGIDGGFVALGQPTSSMKISEMSDLIELIRAFGAERGVVFGEKALSSGAVSSPGKGAPPTGAGGSAGGVLGPGIELALETTCKETLLVREEDE